MPEPETQMSPTEADQGEKIKESQLIRDAKYLKEKIETKVDVDMPDLNSPQGKLLLSEALRYTLSNLEIKQNQNTDDLETIRNTQDQIDGDFPDLVYQFSRLDKSNQLDGLIDILQEKIDPHQAGKMLFSEESDVQEAINTRAKQIVEGKYVATTDEATSLLKGIYKASVYKLVGSTLLANLKEFTAKKERIPEMIETLMASAQAPA